MRPLKNECQSEALFFYSADKYKLLTLNYINRSLKEKRFIYIVHMWLQNSFK